MVNNCEIDKVKILKNKKRICELMRENEKIIKNIDEEEGI
jgi:hypothetical protein